MTITRKEKKLYREQIYTMMQTIVDRGKNKSQIDFRSIVTNRLLEVSIFYNNDDFALTTWTENRNNISRYSTEFKKNDYKQLQRFYDALCYVYLDIDQLFIALQEKLIELI